MRLTKEQYEIADDFLEYLRQKNCREKATVTLIKDKQERIDTLDTLERESNAINILIQTLNSMEVKEG